jgi:oxygen-dependent protoporphyrinogen oxidase
VLFPSSIFQHRTPEGDVLLTIFVGGNRQPELATPDTEELLRLVLPEIGEILGIKDSPCFIHHKYWEKSIPQYNLGYGQFFKQIKDVEKKFYGLQIMGNYRDGISLSNCIEQAIRS